VIQAPHPLYSDEDSNLQFRNQSATPNNTLAFDKEWIDKMATNVYNSKKSIRHLFITIDPSAGKDRNFYALLSMIFVGEKCVV
jgi:hypothetical protein